MLSPLKLDSSLSGSVAKQTTSTVSSQPSLMDQIESEMESKKIGMKRFDQEKPEDSRITINNNIMKPVQRSLNPFDSEDEVENVQEKKVNTVRESQRSKISMEEQTAEFLFEETPEEVSMKFFQRNTKKPVNHSQGIKTGWQEIKEQREKEAQNGTEASQKKEQRSAGVSQLVKQFTSLQNGEVPLPPSTQPPAPRPHGLRGPCASQISAAFENRSGYQKPAQPEFRQPSKVFAFMESPRSESPVFSRTSVTESQRREFEDEDTKSNEEVYTDSRKSESETPNNQSDNFYTESSNRFVEELKPQKEEVRVEFSRGNWNESPRSESPAFTRSSVLESSKSQTDYYSESPKKQTEGLCIESRNITVVRQTIEEKPRGLDFSKYADVKPIGRPLDDSDDETEKSRDQVESNNKTENTKKELNEKRETEISDEQLTEIKDLLKRDFEKYNIFKVVLKKDRGFDDGSVGLILTSAITPNESYITVGLSLLTEFMPHNSRFKE